MKHQNGTENLLSSALNRIFLISTNLSFFSSAFLI